MSDYIATVQFRYIPTNAYFKYGDDGMVLLFHEASEVWVPGASDPSWEYMTNEWLDETMNKSPEKWEILPDLEGLDDEEEGLDLSHYVRKYLYHGIIKRYRESSHDPDQAAIYWRLAECLTAINSDDITGSHS